jgi:hypothetical protein
MGAPKGNQNAVKARIMSRHLLERIEERKLWPQLMDALLTKALDGDVPAIKEVFDRVDGKAPQDINLGGQDDNPLVVQKIVREIVKP